jgi:hypothetical protein
MKDIINKPLSYSPYSFLHYDLMLVCEMNG